MAEQCAEENDHYDEGLGYRHQKQQETNTEKDTPVSANLFHSESLPELSPSELESEEFSALAASPLI